MPAEARAERKPFAVGARDAAEVTRGKGEGVAYQGWRERWAGAAGSRVERRVSRESVGKPLAAAKASTPRSRLATPSEGE